MLTGILVCTMAIVSTTAADSASKAPLVMTIRLPGNQGVETSGNLLVATRYVEGELRYWDWSNLKAEPKTTPSLWPHDTTVLGDGMIAEDVCLGLPHEMLERAKTREKDRAKQKGEKDDGARWKMTEKDKAMMQEFEEKEQKRNQEWADKEDRIVAQMRYLQEMKKTRGKGLVIRSASGKEFSMIDCGNDKDWYISGLTHSHDGKILGVWQCQTIITKDSHTWGIRAGIVDRKTNSVRWVASTTGDAEKNNDGPHTTGLKTRLSDDGKRFLFFGGSGKGGWICLMDTEKQVVLWEHRGVAGTMDFSGGGFSPDGKKVYVGDRLGWVFCFDGDTGKQLPIGKSSLRGSYVAVSPDGTLFAAGSGSGGLLIYNAESGKVLQSVDPQGSFYSVTFSPDNKSLAIASESGILIYDLAAAASSKKSASRSRPVSIPEAPVVRTIEIPLLGGPGYPYLETSGRFLAAMLCEEREVRYWDWSNLKAAPQITPSLSPQGSAVLSDGTIAENVHIVSSHDEQNAERSGGEDRIIAKMKYLQEIKRAGGVGLVIRNVAGTDFTTINCGNEKRWRATGLAHSENGRTLAVLGYLATSDEPDVITMRAGIVDQGTHSVRWTATTEIMKKGGDVALHSDTAVSDDGKRLALFGGIARKGGWICVMDAKKQGVLWENRGMAQTGCFSRGAISPDGRRVYAADELGGVFCFDGDTGKQLAKWDFSGSILLSPDGRLLAIAVGGPKSRVSICDAHTGKLLQYASPGNPHFDIAISPDNKYLAIGANNAIAIHDLTLAGRKGHGEEPLEEQPLTTPPSSPQEAKLPATLNGHMGWVYSVAYRPDGKVLASGSTDNTVKLWDLATRNNTATITGHTGAVKCVAFSHDGKALASASEDKTIKLWNTASGNNIATFNGHTAAVSSVAFSPDNKTLASGSDDTTIKLWELEAGKDTATLRGHSGHVMSVAYSPDGKTLASGCWDGEIKLWDVAAGKNTATLKGHYGGNGGVPCVTFSPDGKTLASAGFDWNIKLWDVATGKNTATFQGGVFQIVFSVAFSPDGKTLASGSASDMVDLWDLATRRNTATLTGHTEYVHSVAFSPDGKTLASGSYDRTIRVWDVKSGK